MYLLSQTIESNRMPTLPVQISPPGQQPRSLTLANIRFTWNGWRAIRTEATSTYSALRLERRGRRYNADACTQVVTSGASCAWGIARPLCAWLLTVLAVLLLHGSGAQLL